MTCKVHIEHFYYISKSYGSRKNSVTWTNLFFMEHDCYLKEWMMKKDLYNLVKQCITL